MSIQIHTSFESFHQIYNQRIILITSYMIALSNIDGFVSVDCSCTDSQQISTAWKLSHTYHVTAQKSDMKVKSQSKRNLSRCESYTYHITRRKSGKIKFEPVWKLQEIVISGDVFFGQGGNVLILNMKIFPHLR